MLQPAAPAPSRAVRAIHRNWPRDHRPVHSGAACRASGAPARCARPAPDSPAGGVADQHQDAEPGPSKGGRGGKGGGAPVSGATRLDHRPGGRTSWPRWLSSQCSRSKSASGCAAPGAAVAADRASDVDRAFMSRRSRPSARSARIAAREVLDGARLPRHTSERSGSRTAHRPPCCTWPSTRLRVLVAGHTLGQRCRSMLAGAGQPR